VVAEGARPPAPRSYTSITWFNGIQTQFRTIDWLSICFTESESRGDHALLLSLWPESLFDLAPTWARLAEHTHLVAIDLPGFGHPQHRDYQILTAEEHSGCPSRTKTENSSAG
jgi:pimeloyl-ACP methyl ester carboxylesterase